MLTGQTIVCFARERWDGLWRNRHQLMTRFVRANRVLWVEPRPYMGDFTRAVRERRLNGWPVAPPRPVRVQENLFVYRDPLWLPVSGRAPLRPLTKRGRALFLQRALRVIGSEFAPILWLTQPDAGDVIGSAREKLVIYHVVDEYAAYELEYQTDSAANRPDSVQAAEQNLLRRADLVFVTSPRLLASKQNFNRNVHLVPNGVDFSSFATARANPVEPTNMAGVPRPRLGFVGAINEKVDLRLLAWLAKQQPKWHFVMVGPVTLRYNLDDLAALQAQPNVHFVGEVPPTQVAQAMLACDVCLMPYKQNAWTQHINPLKLYEYLASGRPVVSTEIDAVSNLQALIGVAQSAEEFVERIEFALNNANQPEMIATRLAFAEKQTWDARVAAISGHVEAALAEKQRS